MDPTPTAPLTQLWEIPDGTPARWWVTVIAPGEAPRRLPSPSAVLLWSAPLAEDVLGTRLLLQDHLPPSGLSDDPDLPVWLEARKLTSRDDRGWSLPNLMGAIISRLDSYLLPMESPWDSDEDTDQSDSEEEVDWSANTDTDESEDEDDEEDSSDSEDAFEPPLVQPPREVDEVRALVAEVTDLRQRQQTSAGTVQAQMETLRQQVDHLRRRLDNYCLTGHDLCDLHLFRITADGQVTYQICNCLSVNSRVTLIRFEERYPDATHLWTLSGIPDAQQLWTRYREDARVFGAPGARFQMEQTPEELYGALQQLAESVQQ